LQGVDLFSSFANAPTDVYDPDGSYYFRPVHGNSGSVQNAPVNLLITATPVYRPFSLPGISGTYQDGFTLQTEYLGTDPGVDIAEIVAMQFVEPILRLPQDLRDAKDPTLTQSERNRAAFNLTLLGLTLFEPFKTAYAKGEGRSESWVARRSDLTRAQNTGWRDGRCKRGVLF
jgi:hypothetical protein